MQLDLEELRHCEWSWGKDQILLRNLNYSKLEIDYERQLDLYGVPYVQGGGRSTFALAWRVDEPDERILLETRDFAESPPDAVCESGLPIWENARLLPESHRHYQRILGLLLDSEDSNAAPTAIDPSESDGDSGIAVAGDALELLDQLLSIVMDEDMESVEDLLGEEIGQQVRTIDSRRDAVVRRYGALRDNPRGGLYLYNKRDYSGA